jgi:hypothetical protein
LWERREEAYPGATVLDDLPAAEGDLEATRRVLARFAALRSVLLALGGHAGAMLAEEQRTALSYIDTLPAMDAERIVLARLVSCAAVRVRRAVAACALDAADLADAGGHEAGAFWLRYTAYVLACEAAWREEALGAARAICRSSADAGAERAARLWRRRVAALEADA